MRFQLIIGERFADHIINAILIFESVFLAFRMNETRIEQQENQLISDAKKAILTEWEINLIILERTARTSKYTKSAHGCYYYKCRAF